jgi:hypothetical protein
MVVCQGRLDAVVPLENASMPGRVVVQWDKDDCADMGIVKIDLLGLGMMAVLQDSLEIVNAERHDAQAGLVGQGTERFQGRGHGLGARQNYFGKPFDAFQFCYIILS